MFQLLNCRTGQSQTVFGVRKSGPHHLDTKFLVHLAQGWRWLPACDFEPMPTPAPTYGYELAHSAG